MPYRSLLMRGLSQREEKEGDKEDVEDYGGLDIVFRAGVNTEDTNLGDFLAGLHEKDPSTHKVILLSKDKVREDAIARACAEDAIHPALIEGEEIYFFDMNEMAQQITDSTDAIFLSRRSLPKPQKVATQPLSIWVYVIVVVIALAILGVVKEKMLKRGQWGA